jgi:glycosyltransferase involved in cell wall biosynthesis
MINTKLTVLLPILKIDNFVAPAIQCIINQTFADFTCYLLCSDSLKNKSEKLEELINNDYRFKIFYLKLGGISFALNFGINLTTSEYIARMDSDDLCPNDRFQKQINFLQNNINYGIVGSRVVMIDQDGVEINQKFKFYENHEKIIDALKYRMPLCHPGLMFRSELLFSLNGYAYGHTSEDHELFLRVARLTTFKFYNLPDLIFFYRRHSSQLSSDKVALSAFRNISGFLLTEFLHKKDPKYIFGMVVNHPMMRTIRLIYRKLKIKYK